MFSCVPLTSTANNHYDCHQISSWRPCLISLPQIDELTRHTLFYTNEYSIRNNWRCLVEKKKKMNYNFHNLEYFQLNWVRPIFFFAVISFATVVTHWIKPTDIWLFFNKPRGWLDRIQFLGWKVEWWKTSKATEKKTQKKIGRYIHIIKLIVSFERFLNWILS